MGRVKRNKDGSFIFDDKKVNYEQLIAMVIAMQVRNEMEDFHCEHLSDKQMMELNPIIRNAIYKVLLSLKGVGEGSKEAEDTISYLTRNIPPYWELPVKSNQKNKHVKS